MTRYAHPDWVSYQDKLDQRDPHLVDLVVIHCTELPDMATAREYAERILYESGTGACGHFYIDRSGKRLQYVRIDRIAHHVRNHNERSIGVELVNLGRYPDWLHSDHQAMTESYPPEQIESLIELLERLVEDLPELRYIAGHEDLDTALVPSENEPSIQVRRKVDPGPLFPWETVLGHVPLQRLDSSDKLR
ncbi:MAG: N-acetylmuramoyl-L-alanine amidase [Xanthomonadales bacterium]|nr:N-acetylmuramoyl-L-alanine amidase [Xanthomonadales bacterium]